MTIADGIISWGVVNTKNISNIRIEIDSSEDRNKHNEQLCQYLFDQEEYDCYFRKVLERRGTGEMKVIEKSVLRTWINKVTRKVKKGISHNNELKFLIKNELRRNLVVRAIH